MFGASAITGTIPRDTVPFIDSVAAAVGGLTKGQTGPIWPATDRVAGSYGSREVAHGST